MPTSPIRFIALIFLQILLFVVSPAVNAQEDNDKTTKAINELKRLSDSVYGSHHELMNGKFYYQKNLYALGTPFYVSDDWIDGAVNVNHLIHYNLKLKYNVVTDQLILKATQRTGKSSPIVLNTAFVESFHLGTIYFVNTDRFPKGIVKSNFASKIYTGKISLFATYKKNFISDYNTKSPHGKFSNLIINYFIYENEELTKISSKKAFLLYFQPYDKEIKKYMKKMKFKFKKADTHQWFALMEYCESFTTTIK